MGTILRDVACRPFCPGPDRCRFAETCAYQILFAPQTPAGAGRLSLNSDLPRPFVMIPEASDVEFVPAGQSLRFAIRLFGTAIPLWPYLGLTFSQLLPRGLGRRRVPCRLARMESGGTALDLQASPGDRLPTRSLGLDLPGCPEASDLEVQFLTPVYLKDRGREVRCGQDAFGALVRRARDRLSALYHFYAGDSEREPVDLDWDFRSLGRQADSVRCLEDRTRWLSRERRSTRTGQSHPLGGLIGSAAYADVPAPLRRLLELASITHVGKHSAFGLGRIAVRDAHSVRR